jgi:hypothetical protein
MTSTKGPRGSTIGGAQQLLGSVSDPIGVFVDPAEDRPRLKTAAPVEERLKVDGSWQPQTFNDEAQATVITLAEPTQLSEEASNERKGGELMGAVEVDSSSRNAARPSRV